MTLYVCLALAIWHSRQATNISAELLSGKCIQSARLLWQTSLVIRSDEFWATLKNGILPYFQNRLTKGFSLACDFCTLELTRIFSYVFF